MPELYINYTDHMKMYTAGRSGKASVYTLKSNLVLFR